MNLEHLVGSARELVEKLDLEIDTISIPQLNEENVPEELRVLIPYAEVFGISDDILRDQFVSSCPEDLMQQLKSIVENYDADLDNWLGGPEADSDQPTNEYIAFSAMRIASYWQEVIGQSNCSAKP